MASADPRAPRAERVGVLPDHPGQFLRGRLRPFRQYPERRASGVSPRPLRRPQLPRPEHHLPGLLASLRPARAGLLRDGAAHAPAQRRVALRDSARLHPQRDARLLRRRAVGHVPALRRCAFVVLGLRPRPRGRGHAVRAAPSRLARGRACGADDPHGVPLVRPAARRHHVLRHRRRGGARLPARPVPRASRDLDVPATSHQLAPASRSGARSVLRVPTALPADRSAQLPREPDGVPRRARAPVRPSVVHAPARILDRGDHAQRLSSPLVLPFTGRLGRHRRLFVRPRGSFLARRRRGPPHDDRDAGPRRGHLCPHRHRAVGYLRHVQHRGCVRGACRAIPLRRQPSHRDHPVPHPAAARATAGGPGDPCAAGPGGWPRRHRLRRRRPSALHPAVRRVAPVSPGDHRRDRRRGSRPATRKHGVPRERAGAGIYPRPRDPGCPLSGARRGLRAIRAVRPARRADRPLRRARSRGRAILRAAARHQVGAAPRQPRRRPAEALTMPYKIYLWESLSAIEWSQAGWKIGGDEECQDELIHDVLLAHLPKDGLIVDAGCGTAKWPIYLGRAGYRCIGIEISREACLTARSVDPAGRLVRADTRRAPLRSGSVDAVLSLGVVEHDEAGPEAGLREIRRLLRPGGLLVLAVPFNNWFRRLVVNHLQTWVTRKRRRANLGLGFAEYRFTAREVQRHLAANGFETIASYPNDLRPPKVMGLWVDRDNLITNPFVNPGPKELFVLPGWSGRLARLALDVAPWAVCGEAAFVARAV